MKILCYDLFCGAACEAAKELGEFVGYIPRTPVPDDPRLFSVAAQLYPKANPRSECDVLLTASSPTNFQAVKNLVAQTKPTVVIWDLGNGKHTFRSIDCASLPLQFLDYETTVVEGVSVHSLGYNIIESRTFIIATADKRDIRPPLLRFPYPEMTLDKICNTEEDEVFERVVGNYSQEFHKDCRPWSHVIRPNDDFHLRACKVGPKMGSVLYLIGDRVHRLRADEACQMQGNPLGFEVEVRKHCETEGQAAFTILSEAGMPVWKDFLARAAYEIR